jgi:hypothetical protein
MKHVKDAKQVRKQIHNPTPPLVEHQWKRKKKKIEPIQM